MRTSVLKLKQASSRWMRRVVSVATLMTVMMVVAVSGAASGARAQSLPAPYLLRPLTLPKGMMRVDGELQLHSYVVPGDRVEQWSLYGAVAGGVTEDLELGALLLPLSLSPDGDYLDPYLYGMYTLHPWRCGVRRIRHAQPARPR
jgi:hypothetical protein